MNCWHTAQYMIEESLYFGKVSDNCKFGSFNNTENIDGKINSLMEIFNRLNDNDSLIGLK